MLSIIVSMYSAFLGLKIGGVYWPIITTSILAMALLTLLRNTNNNEINVAQTAASAGGLLAAGIIFTIPAIWVLGFDISVPEIMFISLVGGIAGIIFSVPLRKEMIEREQLPYPDGTAAAAIIMAGDEGGKKIKTVMAMFGVGAVFSFLRDYLELIPHFWNIDLLKLQAAKLFSFGAGISLVSLAGGYLIGPRFTGAWFLGAIASYFLLIPYLVSAGIFGEKALAMVQFTKPLGIGIVIGAAIAYFLLKGIPAFAKMFRGFRKEKAGFNRFFGLAVIVLVALLTIITEMNLALSVIAILGAFLMAYVGARVTGEMNVDPMEIFAMIVLIAAKIFLGFNAIFLIILAAVVCIAAGIAGDFMQDLKAGFLLRTNPRHQLIAQFTGVIAASLVLGLVLVSLNTVYGIGGIELPAPQAVAIGEIAGAETLETMLAVGAVLGFTLTLITTFLRLGILPVAFGIGVYVPVELSFPLFLGGLIRLFADRRKFTEKGRLMAAGLIGGEGFVGVLIAVFILASRFLLG